MIDATDKLRFSVDEDNLIALVSHPDLKERTIPLVVILNKQDKEEVYHKKELKDFLKLDKLKSTTKMVITIRECSGKHGSGIAECFSFFNDHLL